MRIELWGFWFNVAGVVCWPICFIWMHRISARQEELLKKIQDQAGRIEEVSRTEHELIKEVHPQVNEIRESVQTVADTIGAEASSTDSKP
jgi:hypothetical protein